MSSVIFTTVKSEENAFNSIFPDYQVGDQVKATLVIDSKEFNAMGNTKQEALDDLQNRIDAHYNSQKHIAKTEINKANGEYFFD